ncbi:Creatinase/aminopeptidase [Meredithblackwellia eburnea MCA 4105]
MADEAHLTSASKSSACCRLPLARASELLSPGPVQVQPSYQQQENYLLAGKIAHKVLSQVASLCQQDGITAAELCKAGDEIAERLIQAEAGGNGGIAHPTSLGKNEIVANFAPTTQAYSSSNFLLKAGDFAKIQIGVHVEGYGAVIGETIVVGPPTNASSQTVSCDLTAAARGIADLCLRLIKPGSLNWDISDAVNCFLGDQFGGKVRGVVGLAAHNHTKDDIQGPKTINLFPTAEQRGDPNEECTLEEGEVYAVEVWVTDSPDPVPQPSTLLPTTLFNDARKAWPKDDADLDFVKMMIDHKAGTFPWSITIFDDEEGARAKIEKAVSAGLVDAYPPFLVTGVGSRVAQSVLTFEIIASGTFRITPVYQQ